MAFAMVRDNSHVYKTCLVRVKNANITTMGFAFVVMFENFMMLIHTLTYETGHAGGAVA
jgi:hypothetical protein